MHVGFLLTSVSRKSGGVFTAVAQQARHLQQIGVRVSVFGIADEFTSRDQSYWGKAELHAMPRIGPDSFSWAPGLSSKLQSSELDVLHAHGLWQFPSIAGASWHRSTGRPFVISPHGMLEPWALRNSGWKKRLARFLFEDTNLAGASCVHALNGAEAEAIRAFGLNAPVAVIPNGVDLHDVSLPHERPSWLPNDGRQTLLFLGRIHPKKGLSELIEAWRLIKQRYPAIADSWNVAIAGWDDGGHVTYLQTLIRGYGLQNDVIMPGALHGDDKATALAHADAFVLPSHSEGLPVAILEAWSYGLPVFMTEACNLAEGFEYDAGFRIDAEPDLLVEQLSRGLMSLNLNEAGARGLQLVRDRFSLPSIARQYLELYTWLCGEGSDPKFVTTVESSEIHMASAT